MKVLLQIAAKTLLVGSMGAVAFGQHYTQVNLVSSTSGVAPVTDSTISNVWGISRTSGSDWWVSDNISGLSTLYNGAGTKASLIVTIPANPNNKTSKIGSPTGTIANGSQTDFILSNGKPAAFLFATVDGTIAAWNATIALAPGAAAPSTNAVSVVTTTDGSSYTGITSAFIDGSRYLYAANFTKGRVDVFDNAFKRVNVQNHPGHHHNFDDERFSFLCDEPFVDRRLPRNYVPFNVQAIGNNVVVTYVLHPEGSPFESDGPGLGYVDIYTASGQLVQRLEHGDWLNAPWGVALAPLDFGRFSHDLLIGQFAGGGTTESSGYIAAYDLTTGQFDGLLEDASGKPISINGVWGISFGNVSPANQDAAGAPAAEMYFAAGPNHGSGGLFGYLKPNATDLVKGNDQ
jgi:uncharacterized protein (TIGR03118 family)